MIGKQLISNKKTLLETGVDFIGIINDRGHLEDFIGNEEIPYSEKNKEMFCMEIALQNRMMRDFDSELGEVKYTVTERKNQKFMSIPNSSKVILAVMQKETDHKLFFNKMSSSFSFEILEEK